MKKIIHGISFVLVLCICIGTMMSCSNEKDIYKDEYTKTSTSKTDKKNNNSNNSSETTNVEDINTVTLNPFEEIDILVSGVSPYCTVAINNQNCSADVQTYVNYKLDKKTYANGEQVIITAELNALAIPAYSNKSYKLSSTEYTYSVKGQPEYLTSLTGVNLTKLKAELDDYIEAGKAKVVATSNSNNYLFSLSNFNANESFTAFTSCDSAVLKNTYFSSLKSTKTSDFSLGETPFNQISFIYEMDYSWIHHNKQGKTGTGTAWFNISACNLVKYPDGSIKWGEKSIGASDFDSEYSTQGLDSCITATVTVDSANYNITKIS